MQVKFANWMYLWNLGDKDRWKDRPVPFCFSLLAGSAGKESCFLHLLTTCPNAEKWLCWLLAFWSLDHTVGPFYRFLRDGKSTSAAASLQTYSILNNSSWDHSYVVHSWTHSNIYSVRGGSSPKKTMKSSLEAHLRIHFSPLANNL